MNRFSRRRRPDAADPIAAPDASSKVVGAPTSQVVEVDAAAEEAADFAQRLSDLDRFIGGEPSGRVPGPGTGSATRLPTIGSAPAGTPAVRATPQGAAPNQSPLPPVMPAPGTAAAAARNLPAAPIPAVAPISHPRPRTEEPVVEPTDEAADFVERLGDLDRFIGGELAGDPAPEAPAPTAAAPAPMAPAPAAPAPAASAPAASAPVADPEDEAQEFLDRLGDLDRFIGGS